MKIQIILAFVICSFFISCGPTKKFEKTPEHERHVREVRAERYKKHGFVGKWREYKRTRKKKAVTFTDTLMYDFFVDSSVNVYSSNGRMSRVQSGRLKRHGYYVGDNFYKYFYMRDGFMTLHQGKMRHYLQKVGNFQMAPVRKVVPGIESTEIGPLDAFFFQGEWKIYKKEDPNFNRRNTYLHKLDIGESQADGSYEIQAFYNTSNKLVNDQGTMKVENETIRLAIMNQTKSYTIIGAMGDELILKDSDVIYFMKKIAD